MVTVILYNRWLFVNIGGRMEFIPERLIELRTELGITRAEAASRLNMSAMGYGRYEKGERTPSYQTVYYIAKTFNTSPDYLYGITDDRSATTITISSETDPELFLLVSQAKEDKHFLSRLISYAEGLKK